MASKGTDVKMQMYVVRKSRAYKVVRTIMLGYTKLFGREGRAGRKHAWRKREIHQVFRLENVKERNQSLDKDIHGTITLK